jgi:hypothetical protein
MAAALFGWLNFIVQQVISQRKQIAALYNSLPQSSRDAVVKRDTAP